MDSRREFGAAGEEAACRLLKKSGYRILQRNWTNKLGEIDAVAWEDGELVFVEVRSRHSGEYGTGAESVTPRKQRQVVRAAKVYMKEKKIDVYTQPCRFDVVEMLYRPDEIWEGRIIKGAFGAE